MRKLKLQMQMTLDGFVAGPEGQLDWVSREMDQDQLNSLNLLTQSIDTIVMGRKMAPGFSTYWENVVDNQPESPEYPYAKIFVDTPKVVFSKTVKALPGKNVTVENGDLVESINKLKKSRSLSGDKDIIVYGGANFVSELIKNKLIDELFLFINPIAIGKGLKIFNNQFKFKVLSSIACSNGVVINQYKPVI